MLAFKLGVASAVVLVAGATAIAAIFGHHRLELDFTKPDVKKQATWTTSAKLELAAGGLVHEAPGPALDFWLQTEPFAVGLSWRPARSVSIRATLTPIATAIKLGNGQTSMPTVGRLYARYSPDAKHWSSWTAPTSSTEPAAYQFAGELAVPSQAQAVYNDLVSKYSALPNVPWASDEEAAVKWIAGAQKDFFAKHQTFIGYVQFLYEAHLHGGQRLEHLDFDIFYDVGGIHQTAKDPKVAQNRDVPWRYRAP